MELLTSSSKLFYLFILGCFAFSSFYAQLIPDDEVKVLKAISSKIENLNWNVTSRSCIDGGFKNETIDQNSIIRNVTCNCSFQSGTICHVTNIQLKGLNLSGVLASEFDDLTQLQELDFSRNYLNGTIPKDFAKLPLIKLSLLGNRISGSIPTEISNISTLEELVLEDNLLEGTLPSSLGKLKHLRRLLLSANNLSGTIPESYNNLKKLEDFRLDGNSMSGKLPNFIGNWTQLERLDLQGTSMEGPIPPTIALLTNLIELRISDLRGQPTMTFPNLKNLKSLKYLVLRNCSISGSIPHYIGEMESLSMIDLSFNNLTGNIPDQIQELEKLNYMFLTENSLSGEIPGWILKTKENLDLSYNNFSKTSAPICQFNDINLASSLSSSANTSLTCLKKNLPCEGNPKYHSLFINCGGPKMDYKGNEYESDLNQDGISYFYLRDKWAYSSTGLYFGNSDADYVATNTFSLNITGHDLYQTARLSPSSLKYHGLCLLNGNYNVKLHFAEIMFSNDQTFSSLGRRIFDVSIQGRKYLNEFNIMEEAGGVGKGIIKDFNVDVNDNSLEIHLYWAGKGTTAIPNRGVYGPLISAISITPNFKVPAKGLSGGTIAGIVVAVICVIFILILFVLGKMGFLGRKNHGNKGKIKINNQTGVSDDEV
ncbi:hypothetical protein QN277_008868 [Acacia crassicarpa]|uniref:non-specific serine/threonine protein kinase n=1 Tax=Acacia crassicarpa TaxID=499986 RepID=A0AAE1ITT4_9FABA|nr:hypothetical protein QN277_008868 [Acacia crassicarpa]